MDVSDTRTALDNALVTGASRGLGFALARHGQSVLAVDAVFDDFGFGRGFGLRHRLT